ncbi:MAG TPA: metalloregulator ArsR/SmtB family transcription factor [Dehalococcoidia bacterium]|nr:metalloregulator ArsR/SmtB family transcription factor [Dehalococcoidia bacterium]
MPRLSQTLSTTTQKTEFVLSIPLDLMNAMYFTSLVERLEGIEGWPARVRPAMDRRLLAELDFLYDYPAGDPAIMGILGDSLFAHPEAWAGTDALVEYIRAMPDGMGDGQANLGVQGLVYEATFRYLEPPDRSPYEGLPPREAIERRMRSLGDRDADAIMALFDRPQELRSRMVRLIQRFYEQHYRHELPKRLPCLERSVAAHRARPTGDVIELTRRLTGRPTSCLEDVCPGPYDRLVFAPSLDMGPYTSCAAIGRVHGMLYPCEPEFLGAPPEAAEETRLARLFKALSDEQRLRILRLLREREMYAQEMVERTGLHQSVLSRHLAFMKAVGLVTARRQNNMKFYSLNPAMREELAKTMELFPAAGSRE